MKQANNIKIQFCYPEISSGLDKKTVINDIAQDIKNDKEIGFAGFAETIYLKKYLVNKVSKDSIQTYKKLSVFDFEKIEKVTNSILKKCLRHLPLSSVHVFIFPWLNEEAGNGDESFEGVNGFAPYPKTIHLFISPVKFTFKSLEETLVHEFNHAAFFDYRKSAKELTLLEAFVFEGLAENFREEVIGGDVAPWSNALETKESKTALESLRNFLKSDKYDLYKEVFFGSKKYKKWTGYSIGYNIVKSFRQAHPNKTWEEIMRMEAEVIFEISPFAKN